MTKLDDPSERFPLERKTKNSKEEGREQKRK